MRKERESSGQRRKVVAKERERGGTDQRKKAVGKEREDTDPKGKQWSKKERWEKREKAVIKER